MIIRLSQKLAAKIGAGPLKAAPLDENPFADWSAHLFTVQRAQYVILTNTTSLYSTVFFGRGVTDDNALIQRTVGALREFLEDDGQAFVYRRFIEPATGTVRFAKSLNRSVTGSMNDLINHAKAWLLEGELSPHDVGFQLNDILLSALARSENDFYWKPREAFKDLLQRSGKSGADL